MFGLSIPWASKERRHVRIAYTFSRAEELNKNKYSRTQQLRTRLDKLQGTV